MVLAVRLMTSFRRDMDDPTQASEDQDQDYHSFTQSSPGHRLPTLNGVQALLDVVKRQKPISTNLAGLNATLRDATDGFESEGGIPRGRVTEVYGGPGCGKTQFAIQLAANALTENDEAGVIWIDTSAMVDIERLKHLCDTNIKNRQERGEQSSEDLDPQQPQQSQEEEPQHFSLEDRFHHLIISSLPHLLALLTGPPEDFPPQNTALLVLEDMSNLALLGLPQNENPISTSTSANPTTNTNTLSPTDIIARTINARRAAMLSSISATLARLAARHNLALLVTNKTRSAGTGKNATLRSALNSPQWNESIAARIVLYRDFWSPMTPKNWARLSRSEKIKQRRRERYPLRVALVERVGGKDVSARGVKFVILRRGLHAVEVHVAAEVVPVVALPSSPPLPTEEEEAMQNLGLGMGDVPETEDQSLRMPEDTDNDSSSVAPSQQGKGKRKRVVEVVGDSKDEEEQIGFENARSRLTEGFEGHAGFLPSSQLAQEDGEVGSRRAVALRHLHVGVDDVTEEEEEEMLV